MASSRRSLAACRMLAGATIVFEATIGIADPHNTRAFLTDDGLWSRIDQIETGYDGRPSLFLANGQQWWASLLVTLLLASGILLAYGWRTRLSSAVAYVLWCSVLDRCWLTTNSFDDLTAVLLLWGALGLPWSEVWSVDACLRTAATTTMGAAAAATTTTRAFPLARAGLWVSTSVVYVLAGYAKSHVSWQTGEAVLLAMGTVHLQRPLARHLCASAYGAAALTLIGKTVRVVEILAPLLLVLPTTHLPSASHVPSSDGASAASKLASFVRWMCSGRYWWIARLLSVVALFSMHVSIGLTLRLNAIGLINSAALAAFLPDRLWDALGESGVVRRIGLRTSIVQGAEALDVLLGFRAVAAMLVHARLEEPPETNAKLQTAAAGCGGRAERAGHAVDVDAIAGSSPATARAPAPLRQRSTSPSRASPKGGAAKSSNAGPTTSNRESMTIEDPSLVVPPTGRLPPLSPLAANAVDLACSGAHVALIACRLFVLLFLLVATLGGEMLPATPLWAVGTSLSTRLALDVTSGPNATWSSKAVHAAREHMRFAGQALRLDQKYNVFAPRPPSEVHWMVFPAVLRSGVEIDVFHALKGEVRAPFHPLPRHLVTYRANVAAAGGDGSSEGGVDVEAPPNERAPPSVLPGPYATFDPRIEPPPNYATEVLHDDHWAKYSEVMIQGWGDLPEGSEKRTTKQKQQERIRMQLGRWICRTWNRVHGGSEHEVRTFSFVIYLGKHEVHDCPRGHAEGNNTVSENRVWDHRCFD